MERQLSAKDVLFWIDPANGEAFRLVACLTDNSFTGSRNTVDSSTKCGDGSVPGTASASWNIAGVVLASPDVEETTGRKKISGPELYSLFENGTTFSYLCSPAIPQGGDWIMNGSGYFSSFNWNNQNGNPSEFTATLTASGLPESLEVSESV